LHTASVVSRFIFNYGMLISWQQHNSSAKKQNRKQ
jgi:hypothetical protein